jgi:hypothetical protein
VAVLAVSIVGASWLGMTLVHEAGHALAAWVTGGRVVRMVLHPLGIPRTEVAPNPQPLVVVWGGPILGVAAPLALWGLLHALRCGGAYLWRFFAAFCLVANGAYLAAGSLLRAADAGDMLRLGSPPGVLWAFGGLCVPLGFVLWHRQGKFFGLGRDALPVSASAAYGTAAGLLLLALLHWVLGMYCG